MMIFLSTKRNLVLAGVAKLRLGRHCGIPTVGRYNAVAPSQPYSLEYIGEYRV